MDVLTFYNNSTKAQVDQLARKAKTSPAYIYQLAVGIRQCSKAMALRLEAASGGKINAVYAVFPERLNKVA